MLLCLIMSEHTDLYPLGLMIKSFQIQEDIFMARRRKLSPERKEFINGLLEHYQPNDTHDVQEMLKELLAIPFRECSKQKWIKSSVIPSMITKTQLFLDHKRPGMVLQVFRCKTCFHKTQPPLRQS